MRIISLFHGLRNYGGNLRGKFFFVFVFLTQQIHKHKALVYFFISFQPSNSICKVFDEDNFSVSWTEKLQQQFER